MSTSAFFFALGTLSGVVIASVLWPLVSAIDDVWQKRIRLALFSIVPAGIAFGIYAWIGSASSITTATPVSVAAAASMTPSGDGAAGSMEEAVRRLVERLSTGAGKDEDWNLLAQSQEFLGRPEDTARARRHELPSTDSAAATDSVAPLDVAAVARLLPAGGAETAVGAGGKPDSAADWADRADRLAQAQGGSLLGGPEDAIARSLALDPKWPKALWLAASAALQRKDYPAARSRWLELRAAMPESSLDRPIVEANLAEVDALIAAQPVSAAAIRGRIDLPSTLRAQASGSVLFVFAKESDAPGPPLAALRLVPGSWPVEFTLDDSLAMLPTRKLSGAERAFVEARLSRRGEATAAPDDLVASGQWVATLGGPRLVLQLARRKG